MTWAWWRGPTRAEASTPGGERQTGAGLAGRREDRVRCPRDRLFARDRRAGGRRRPRRLHHRDLSRPRRAPGHRGGARGLPALQGRRVAGAQLHAHLLERLGVLDKVNAHGFLTSTAPPSTTRSWAIAATFTSARAARGPHFTFDVHRAEFDQVLLDHAVAKGSACSSPPRSRRSPSMPRASPRGSATGDGERERCAPGSSWTRPGATPSSPRARAAGSPCPASARSPSSPTSRAPSRWPGPRRGQCPDLHLSGGLVLVHPARP